MWAGGTRTPTPGRAISREANTFPSAASRTTTAEPDAEGTGHHGGLAAGKGGGAGPFGQGIALLQSWRPSSKCRSARSKTKEAESGVRGPQKFGQEYPVLVEGLPDVGLRCRAKGRNSPPLSRSTPREVLLPRVTSEVDVDLRLQARSPSQHFFSARLCSASLALAKVRDQTDGNHGPRFQ